MDKPSEGFENILNPALLKKNLLFASLYIALYENFKSTIIDDVKFFYLHGAENNAEEFKKYEKYVLNAVKSPKNRQIRSTLLWLKQHGAICSEDIKDFKNITNMRNVLAHDMLNILIKGLPDGSYDLYAKMLKLFEKISKWWIVEIEIPASGNFPVEQYDSMDWDRVISMNIEFIKIMEEIAFTDTSKYYDEYIKESGVAQQSSEKN